MPDGQLDSPAVIMYRVDSATGCWVWQQYCAKDGYGRVGRQGRLWLAHRWFYTQAKGEIPEGLELDHLCRNRSCVNPDHLEPVTTRENTHRGSRTKLTAAEADAIRESTGDALAVARQYGIARSTVYNIRGGWLWGTRKRPARLRASRNA